MCTESPDQRELYCTWHTAHRSKWADHQSKEEQQQFKDLNPFGWESCLLLVKSKESSMLAVTAIFGWQKPLLKPLQATHTRTSQKKIPFSLMSPQEVPCNLGWNFPSSPEKHWFYSTLLPGWAGETAAPIPLIFQPQDGENLLITFTGTGRLLLPSSMWDITGVLHTTQMES